VTSKSFKLLLNRGILPADIMILIVGLSMFLVFQTIPILVRNPPPFGFGGNLISTTRVQLPFTLIRLQLSLPLELPGSCNKEKKTLLVRLYGRRNSF
jgi:hypothetical protein